MIDENFAEEIRAAHARLGRLLAADVGRPVGGHVIEAVLRETIDGLATVPEPLLARRLMALIWVAGFVTGELATAVQEYRRWDRPTLQADLDQRLEYVLGATDESSP